MSTLLSIGNVGPGSPPHSTENDYRVAFESLGWTVDTMREAEMIRLLDSGAHGPLFDRAFAADAVCYVMTQGRFPKGEVLLDLWAACERVGVATFAVHLDLYYGLASPKDRGPQRYALPSAHPMFKVSCVFTADGGHDADFARDGVHHYWLPPGVNHEEAIDVEPGPVVVTNHAGNGRTIEPGEYDVGFAGSDGYHPEWPHRPQLVEWLRDTYGDRFLHIGGSATRRVTGLDLNRVFASVPIWVGDSCLTRPDFPYWSDRVPETWGRGGFLIHPRVDALTDYYRVAHPGDSWIAGDWEALHDEIAFWGDPTMREARRVFLAGHTRTFGTYRDRARTILETIGLPTGAE